MSHFSSPNKMALFLWNCNSCCIWRKVIEEPSRSKYAFILTADQQLCKPLSPGSHWAHWSRIWLQWNRKSPGLVDLGSIPRYIIRVVAMTYLSESNVHLFRSHSQGRRNSLRLRSNSSFGALLGNAPDSFLERPRLFPGTTDGLIVVLYRGFTISTKICNFQGQGVMNWVSFNILGKLSG